MDGPDCPMSTKILWRCETSNFVPVDYLFDVYCVCFISSQTIFKVETEKPKTEKIRGIQGFKSVLQFPRREEAKSLLLVLQPPKVRFFWWQNQNITSPAPHHQNQPPDFGSVHESQQQQLRLSLHRSHRHTCCVRVRRVFYNFPWREAAQLMCLAALRCSWRLPFENLGPRFCQEGTFPAIWKSWEDF